MASSLDPAASWQGPLIGLLALVVLLGTAALGVRAYLRAADRHDEITESEIDEK